jgi:hypothetical protein
MLNAKVGQFGMPIDTQSFSLFIPAPISTLGPDRIGYSSISKAFSLA